ncbi:BMP family ABC transporter substrate-binding protein [Chakrabartyella piscis]|uniref:BMP family ABC transporter substrate-binding protein n=1 Tax=Chakrabartyella piscis TaxID=2918914 RepID=UPI002958C908|nr:BMP family ABC transporter substrate-binding protein [Chakrabartyella piscis]
MKKLLALALAMSMVVSVAGCGSSSTSTSEADSSSSASAESAEEVVSADEDFMVGAIYITSQNDTAGYTYQHHNGITTAMENLGLDTATQLKIVDNVPEDDTQVAAAIDNLAGQGCDVIFGISFGYINAMDAAANQEEYSDIVFSHATGYMSNESNFNNYFGRIYQARYLSGIAAGMKSLEVGNDNLGYVAAWNLGYAETCSGINAFTLGVQAVNPDATVYVNEISSWGDEALERQAAQALIDTYNVGIITQHSDSAQPQMVAEENGIYGCGYNSDMTEQAPAAHITAPVWNWYIYYQEAMEAVMADSSSFMSTVGNFYGGLAEGFVDVSPLSDNAAAGTQEIIDEVAAMMVAGEWDVFSGVSLEIAADGTITQVEEPVMKNDGTEADPIDDGVICGSMNYNVAGVVAG